jgi:hypothetical protein
VTLVNYDLDVEAAEPSLPSWIQGLGVENTGEVPSDNRLDFASLRNGRNELMLLIRISLREDIPNHELEEEVMRGPTVLFLEGETLRRLEERWTAVAATVAHPRSRRSY